MHLQRERERNTGWKQLEVHEIQKGVVCVLFALYHHRARALFVAHASRTELSSKNPCSKQTSSVTSSIFQICLHLYNLHI